jgi:DNA-binding PadR family transcriptional regulator
MIKSSKIQEMILGLLSDEQNHSVQEIKRYLEERNIISYSEGQFAGSINTLLRNGSIRKIERGIYSIITKREAK